MKYTREVLEAAARESTSVAGVLRYLGLEPAGGMHHHIKRRLVHFGIDISHFTRAGRLKYTRELLEDAARRSISIAGVMRILGMKSSGSSQTYIRKRLIELDIDTSHFKGQGHALGRRARNRLNPERILVIRPSGSTRAKPTQLRRALTEQGVPYMCTECDLAGEWRGKTLILHVDHMNGDYLDCRRENLQFLCPNCHSQTWNYAGRSKLRPKSGRNPSVGYRQDEEHV